MQPPFQPVVSSVTAFERAHVEDSREWLVEDVNEGLSVSEDAEVRRHGWVEGGASEASSETADGEQVLQEEAVVQSDDLHRSGSVPVGGRDASQRVVC